MAASRATRPSVSASTPTLIASGPATKDSDSDDWRGYEFLIKNVTAAAAIYLDTTLNSAVSAVDATNGFLWDIADGPLTIKLEAGERLYALSASGAQTVHVLPQGR